MCNIDYDDTLYVFLLIPIVGVWCTNKKNIFSNMMNMYGFNLLV